MRVHILTFLFFTISIKSHLSITLNPQREFQGGGPPLPPTTWHFPDRQRQRPNLQQNVREPVDDIPFRILPGTTSPKVLATEFIDLTYKSYCEPLQPALFKTPVDYQGHFRSTRVLNVTVGKESSKCIGIYDKVACTGMSLQFMNVDSKTFILTDSQSTKEKLLNFNVCPASLMKCDPAQDGEIESWRTRFCRDKFQLVIHDGRVHLRPKVFNVTNSCISFDKPKKPPTFPDRHDGDFTLLVQKDFPDPVCLDLFTKKNCEGDVVQLIIPENPFSYSQYDTIKIWEYFSNASGFPMIDTDVNSVRKCKRCLDAPPPPEKKQLKIPTAAAVASSQKNDSSQNLHEEDSFCDFRNCIKMTQNLSEAIGKTGECYFFFDESECSTRPILQTTRLEINFTELDEIREKYGEFANWSLADCTSHKVIPEKCLTPSSNLTLREQFLLQPWDEWTGLKSKETAAESLADRIVIGVAGTLAIIMFLIVLAMAVMLLRKKRRVRQLRQRHCVPRQATMSPGQQRHLNVHQIGPVDENDYVNDITGLQALIRCFAGEKYELSRASIDIGNIRDSTASIIGVGEFSIAFRGRLEPSGIAVAVKTIKSGQATARSMKGALKECQVFMMLGKYHRIVEFLGVCTEGVKNGELFVVMEYCDKGPLRSFLVQHKSHFVNLVEDEEMIPKNEHIMIEALRTIQDGPPVRFNTFQLLKWCFEVADAMEFLAIRKIVHVSLSSRNVLLDSNYSSKISDFHLAKIPGENSVGGYNGKTATNKLHERLIPWRWFAVESLLDDLFSTQSDVWTFGIFMWEVFTLGSTPYPEYHHGPEFTLCLKHGYRLLKPSFATIECYELMLICWYDAPEKRPSFTKLKSRLGEMIQNSS